MRFLGLLTRISPRKQSGPVEIRTQDLLRIREYHMEENDFEEYLNTIELSGTTNDHKRELIK
jgi:hypothetical protein